MFAALEFDHALFKPQIKWIVVECSAVARKCGGAIALPPRRDRAYFVDPRFARTDAELYADFKNKQELGSLGDIEQLAVVRANANQCPAKHFAYPWDHLLMVEAPLSWAVLEWSGDESEDSDRVDSAYFTNLPEAELDAKIFAHLRDMR
jgi:hypothetical protein